MKRITIVEDTLSDSSKLKDCIEQYFSTIGEAAEISVYANGLKMLNEFNCHEDIIFLDIDLPGINGLDLASKIREIDSEVIIIFISNLAQYALRGYKVAALDYIVKPFNYTNIEHRLRRALSVKKRKGTDSIILKISSVSNVVLDVNSIEYIEKDANYVVFHTEKGKYRVRGSLGDFEQSLPKELFSYCIKGIMVNLSYVQQTTQDSVVLKNATLPISRLRRKEFINDFFAYFGAKQGAN